MHKYECKPMLLQETRKLTQVLSAVKWCSTSGLSTRCIEFCPTIRKQETNVRDWEITTICQLQKLMFCYLTIQT